MPTIVYQVSDCVEVWAQDFLLEVLEAVKAMLPGDYVNLSLWDYDGPRPPLDVIASADAVIFDLTQQPTRGIPTRWTNPTIDFRMGFALGVRRDLPMVLVANEAIGKLDMRSYSVPASASLLPFHFRGDTENSSLLIDFCRKQLAARITDSLRPKVL